MEREETFPKNVLLTLAKNVLLTLGNNVNYL